MDDNQKLSLLKSRIGEFHDFPKKGILFRDLFTAITDGETCKILKNLLVSHVKKYHPDVESIAGLESRGFLFNFSIASELGVGCVAIRKKGKLPGECISLEYALEYGNDVFEIQKNAFKPGQKILLVDDLLATGGSLEAAVKLVRKAGGHVLGCFVIMELEFLNGRQKLDCSVHSLIQYKN